jgi:hypothetical protein
VALAGQREAKAEGRVRVLHESLETATGLLPPHQASEWRFM